MRRVTPHSAATSSIEVAAKPDWANAAAAPRRVAAGRSSRRRRRRPVEGSSAFICIHGSIHSRSMGTLQVEFTEAELLADHDVVEPLLAGGVRCHGGFDAEGRYVSPRTKHRVPAITAWQARHLEVFGHDLPHIPPTDL